MEGRKIISKSTRSFESLPPRVIIHDILTYHCLENPPRSKPFELFGYLRKDRLRNILLIFRSISFDKEWESNSKIETIGVFIDSSGIFSLEIGYRRWFIDKIIEQSPKMKNLEILQINSFTYYENCSLSGIFSRQSCFSALKSLSVTFCSLGWEKNGSEVWKNLKSLTLMPTYLINDFLGIFSNMKMIKKIDLYLADVENQLLLVDPFTIDLPNVVDMKICRCTKHIQFKTGGKVENLELSGVDASLVEDLYRANHHLKKLFLSNIISLDFSLLFDKNVNHLQNLEELYMFRVQKKVPVVSVVTKDEKVPGSEVYHFGRNLESLKLMSMNDLADNNTTIIHEENISEMEYPRLKVLMLEYVVSENWGKRRWKTKICEQLKELTVTISRHFQSDTIKIFEVNDFTNLESLSFSHIGTQSKLTCEGWNTFPRLKKLEFCSMDSLPDDYFFKTKGKFKRRNRNDFSKLVHLHLNNCRLLTGNWDQEFSRLVKVAFWYMDRKKFSDAFFQNNVSLANSLETIEIRNCQGIRGRNWVFFHKLRVLDVFECKNIRSDFVERDKCFNDEICDVRFRGRKKMIEGWSPVSFRMND